MADKFIIPYGADYPHLETTITDENNQPVTLSGTCELHYKKRYGDEIIKSATILDQSEPETVGKITASGIGKVNGEPLPPGDYKLQIHVTFSNLELGIFPVEDAPYDNPTCNEIIIQKPL